MCGRDSDLYQRDAEACIWVFQGDTTAQVNLIEATTPY